MSKQAPARPVPAAQAADAAALQPELAAPACAEAVPAVRTADASAVAAEEDATLPPDAHGHDPALYDWYPVLRRPRADGWTPAKQRLFIETLADTASPKQAAEAVGMTPSSAYKLRRSPGGEGFAAAWDAAVHQGAKRLVDIALERAVDGVEEPVFDRDGHVIHLKTRYNDRLLMFLIRAHLPDRYQHAHRDRRPPGDPAPVPEPPVAEAVARLEPARPAEPEKTADADEMDERLLVASHMDGEVLSGHDPMPRERRGERIRARYGVPDVEPAPDQVKLDRMVDAMHAEARARNNPRWTPEFYKHFCDEGEDDEPMGRRARRRTRGRAR